MLNAFQENFIPFYAYSKHIIQSVMDDNRVS